MYFALYLARFSLDAEYEVASNGENLLKLFSTKIKFYARKNTTSFKHSIELEQLVYHSNRGFFYIS